MSIRKTALLGLFLVSVEALRAPQAMGAEPTSSPAGFDEKERAREFMKEGVDAFKAGDYEAARVALEKSFQMRPSHDAAGVLGQTYLALGNHLKAANYLAYCVDHYPTAGKRELLQKIDDALTESAKRVLGIRVFANVDGSSVTIDGTSTGKTPADRSYVEPGEHTVIVTHPDGRSETRKVSGVAGQSVTVTVAFDASKASSPGPVASGLGAESDAPKKQQPSESKNVSTPSEESSLKWPVVITTGALGVVGVGVGVGFLVDSNGKTSSAEAIGSDITANGGNCEAASSSRCAEYQDLIAQSDQSKTLAAVGFVAGGTLIAASVAMAVLWPEAPAKVSVSKDGMMISLGGTF